jgi:hypothetical protein
MVPVEICVETTDFFYPLGNELLNAVERYAQSWGIVVLCRHALLLKK